jgi:hypothetical protein
MTATCSDNRRDFMRDEVKSEPAVEETKKPEPRRFDFDDADVLHLCELQDASKVPGPFGGIDSSVGHYKAWSFVCEKFPEAGDLNSKWKFTINGTHAYIEEQL